MHSPRARRRGVRVSGIGEGRVRVTGLTFGELLRLRGVVMMSALELTRVVEASRNGRATARPGPEPAERASTQVRAPIP